MSDETRPPRPASLRPSEDRSAVVVELAVDMPVSRRTLFAYLENKPGWNRALKAVTSPKAADLGALRSRLSNRTSVRFTSRRRGT